MMKNLSFNEKINYIFETIFIMSGRLETFTDMIFKQNDFTFKEWLLSMYVNQKVEGLYEPDISDLACQMNISAKDVKVIAQDLISRGLLERETEGSVESLSKYLLTDQGQDFWRERKNLVNILGSLIISVLSDKEVKLLFKIFSKLYRQILYIFNDRKEIISHVDFRELAGNT